MHEYNDNLLTGPVHNAQVIISLKACHSLAQTQKMTPNATKLCWLVELCMFGAKRDLRDQAYKTGKKSCPTLLFLMEELITKEREWLWCKESVIPPVLGILVLFYLVLSFMAGCLLQSQPNAFSSKNARVTLPFKVLLTHMPARFLLFQHTPGGWCLHQQDLPDLFALLSAGLSASAEYSSLSSHPFLRKIPLPLSLEADLRCHLFHDICDSSTCRPSVLHPPPPSFHHPGSDMKNTLDGTKSSLVTIEEKMSGFDDKGATEYQMRAKIRPRDKKRKGKIDSQWVAR